MHPGFYGWWRAQRAQWEGAPGHCGGPCERAHHGHHHHHDRGEAHFAPSFDHDPSSAFGVRRPLRFLAHKLELSEEQVALFAAILDDLKTERAQAAVDQRRRLSALAEAFEGATFDTDKAQRAGEEHVKSADRVRVAVERALSRLHAALDDEQRKRLATMLRTGVITL